ncbi:unnamed protein product [Paramecium primaurelia]|uniref:Transmembrane protein n=1 Tax=Paramecium primaurelia TaxID=5886 RepID=A0A8S1PTN4_PARPR|nr:unnamed protein product [Paramecium primaurelia]
MKRKILKFRDSMMEQQTQQQLQQNIVIGFIVQFIVRSLILLFQVQVIILLDPGNKQIQMIRLFQNVINTKHIVQCVQSQLQIMICLFLEVLISQLLYGRQILTKNELFHMYSQNIHNTTVV